MEYKNREIKNANLNYILKFVLFAESKKEADTTKLKKIKPGSFFIKQHKKKY